MSPFFQWEFLIYSILHCVKTLQESLNSMRIILAKNEADTRIDGTVQVTHRKGDRVVGRVIATTRQVQCKE